MSLLDGERYATNIPDRKPDFECPEEGVYLAFKVWVDENVVAFDNQNGGWTYYKKIYIDGKSMSGRSYLSFLAKRDTHPHYKYVVNYIVEREFLS
jgi:hypothetical protein